LLRDIVAHAPNATIIRFGRPLGGTHRPMCQDVLISVEGSPDTASLTVSLERDDARAKRGVVTRNSSEP
jgi:hypothetical protein